MSCNDADDSDSPTDTADATVERHIELPAPPEVVWDELPAVLGDDVELTPEPGGALRARGPEGDRVGVVDEAEPGARLAFRWVAVEGDEPPSEVEITLERSAVGTILRLRETRLDGAHLRRAAFRADARACARA